jgi:2-polyprenyl-6-methoxyphenol hydroxylase-like FAD-dependent oxidoreductase
MANATDIDIAIIGGGIAGLSAAIACKAAGVEAHVYEAAPAFAPLGTSLSLWPNAMACLAKWGLAEAVAQDGQVIDHIAWRRPDGRPYFVYPLAGLTQDLGHSGICLRRSDLHQHLAAAVDPAQLHLNHRLTAVSQQGDRVTLEFEVGTRLLARQVIWADGINAPLRQHVLGHKSPTYAGYGAWAGLSAAPFPNALPNEGCEYIGAQARMGVFETGRDTRYWFVIARSPEVSRHARPARAEECAPVLHGWPNALRQLPLQSDPASVVYVSFFDRRLANQWGANHWGKGNITLIGDAMHPFLPNLGQGACQAMEDAYVLGLGLAQGLRGDRLNVWMKSRRQSRVRYMQRLSNRLGRWAQSPLPAARASLRLLGLPPLQAIMRTELKKQFTGPAQ